MFDKKWFVITICFLTMFIMAVATGLRGLLVPSLMTYFSIGNAEIGLLFTITTAVSVPAAYLAGFSNKRFGFKNSVLFGVLLSAASYSALILTKSYVFFIFGFSMISVGTTFIVIGLSTIVTIIRVPWQAVLVNMIHFFFGFGYAVSQKVAGPMIVMGTDWQTLFGYVAMLFALSAGLILVTKLPHSDTASEVAPSASTEASVKMDPLYLVFLMLSLAFYVAAEFQTGNWIVNYLVDTYQYNEDQAGLYSAIFFATFSIGRLFGGFIAEKMGYFKAVGSFLVLATLTYVSGLLLGEPGLWLVAGSGFFFSLVYPTMTLAIINQFPELKASILSRITVVSNLLCLITSLGIGYLNDLIGIKLTFWIMPISLLIACIFFFLAIKRKLSGVPEPA